MQNRSHLDVCPFFQPLFDEVFLSRVVVTTTAGDQQNLEWLGRGGADRAGNEQHAQANEESRAESPRQSWVNVRNCMVVLVSSGGGALWGSGAGTIARAGVRRL